MTTIFLNGKFYLGGGMFAEAVAVRDGRFVFIGSNRDVREFGMGGRQIDLGGRTVLPGFNDSHLHLYNTGVMRSSLRLGECRSVADCIAAGVDYIKRNNILAGQTIVGYLWNQSNFSDGPRYLDRHDLDKISTSHPIVAYRACVHVVSCNSLALKMAGITKDTQTPHGGEIYRDERGEPNGVLAENAFDLLKPILPKPDVTQMSAIIKSAMDYCTSLGITSVQTNDIRDGNFIDMLAAYNQLYDNGNATLRTYHQCFFSDPTEFNAFMAASYKTGKILHEDLHKIGPLKMFVDGSLGGRTAALRSPYHDAPDTRGILTMTTHAFEEMVEISHNAGMSCVVHAIGDAAMDMVLDGYKKVLQGGKNALRHGIIHCQITDRQILERMAEMGVLALIQPIFLQADMKILDSRVGAKLARTSYAWATMDELGVRASYGTDAPVEDACPIANLHCAINRQDLDKMPPDGYNPAEKVGLERAIHNYTAESAFASFDENAKGRIATGFLADMAVLDKDIFAIDASEILDVKVAATILNGEIVMQRDIN